MDAIPDYIRAAPIPEAAPDRLAALRAGAEQLRQAELEVAKAEETLSNAKAERLRLAHQELPDLMDAAGVDRVGLPAAGNLPACDAVCQAYYHANIAADWPQERRSAAFDYLEGVAPDLVRVTVSVIFGKGQMDDARMLAEALLQNGYSPEMTQGVPWASLTAWLREQVERHQAAPPLDVIGATVGRVVKIKPRKD